ncbi:MAG: hypothetical protein C0508_25980 [Cyanobacteria bacterium PR.023]|nr:hypothetical protein [Cyanobacteria bacterium PR.023]
MVHFYHWSDMQKPGVIDTWDKWAKGLMHIVYADVSATPGQKSMFEDYLIYVRSDKKIMMKTSGYSNSKNLELLRAAVDRLNGREELAFPTPLVADTVFISGQIAFAPERISRDVWGRPEPKEKSNWNQYAW